MSTTFLTILSLFTCFLSFSQIDFNNYKTIESKGIIPKDFVTETYLKLEEGLAQGRDELNRQDQKIFLQGINYAIDEILHSGKVIYGDEITQYLEEIVDKLLINEPNLRSKLRIYTLKDNTVNAFSTDQGILFVTTGLVAQVTSEAQLAYVLAHEIAHYTEKHVVETFTWKSQNRYKNIDQLSIYSKDKEFTADKKALKWYNEAQYSKQEILPTFDVLMYSYLPFDEIEVPKYYFNTRLFFIPESQFPSIPYEIKAVEDEDDTRSSHPNIKKRKDSVSIALKEYINWGGEINSLGDDKFNYLREIARFESVRNDIIQANYADALYSIFLLEKKHPQSAYLMHMKAQCWLNILIYKYNGKISGILDKKSDLEGAVGSVHHFFKGLSKVELESVALHQIYQLIKEFPDEEITSIWKMTIKNLVFEQSFKIEKYSEYTFVEAVQKHSEDMLNKNNDSSKNIESQENTLTKYDRIKSTKNIDNPEHFDSSKYYLYGMSDLIKDDLFSKNYSVYKESFDTAENTKSAYDKLSYQEKKKYDRLKKENALRIGITELIVVEPTVVSYKRKEFDPVKSEKLESTFSEIIKETAAENEIVAHTIDRRSVTSHGTAVFNERNLLMAFFHQMVQESDFNAFPVDFSQLKEIQMNYGTSKILFSYVEHYKEADINWYGVGMSAIVYPFFPIVLTTYIPIKLFTSNHTQLSFLVLDIESGLVDLGQTFNWNEPIYKHNLGSHMHNIFHNLKSLPQ